MKLPFFKSKKKTTKRSYDAGASNRLLSDWLAVPTSADAEIYGDIAKVRERARELERNETYVEKFLFELENNIVGDKGIILQSEPMQQDGSGKVDRLAKDAIEWAWHDQNKIENYTVTKQLSGVDADRLALRCIARDGELIVRIVKGYNNKFGFAVQFIEPDQLDHHYNGEYQGREIRMGIELNEFGVPLAYWIDQEHPGDYYVSFRSQGKRRIRVPADEIIFPFRQQRAGQTRGMSWLVNAMTHLKMLGGYEEAELVAARTAASKMGFFYSEGTDYGETDPDNPEAHFTMEAEPGLMDQLPAGLKFQAWDPQHPSTAFEGFRKAMLRRIASGLTMSYNTLANDLEGVNYSSLRDGKITERDGYKVIQNWMINSYKRPIFLNWLEHSLDMGLIRINQGRGAALPFSKFDKFAEHSFVPRRWQWVDPKKDAEALQLMRDNNWTSDSEIIAERGGEIDTLYKQIAEDNKLAESMGITEVDSSDPGASEELARQKLGFETLKAKFDSYGVGVRAGSITPQISDEDEMRKEAGLPPLSEAARKAWEEDGGYRRPITLQSGKESEAQIDEAKTASSEDDAPPEEE